MEEIKFRNWLLKNKKSKKVISDTIARLKKMKTLSVQMKILQNSAESPLL